MSSDTTVVKTPDGFSINVLKIPKPIAEIALCGSIYFTIDDSTDWIAPTPEQIKNLHDMLCIDVKLL